MTLETLSRPPVVDFLQQDSPIKPPVIDLTAFSDLSPQRKKVLNLVNEYGGTVDRDTFRRAFYPEGEITTDRATVVRMHVRLANKDLEERVGKKVILTREENPTYILVEANSEVELPNGKKVKINGKKRSSILNKLIDKGNEGISPLEIYPNARSPLTATQNLELHATRLNRQLPDGYKIVLRRNRDKAAKFILTNKKTLDKLTLPNGNIAEGLTPQGKELLQYLTNINLPVYMSELSKKFKPNSQYFLARKAIQVEFSRINKQLDGTGVIIKKVNRYKSPNPAYGLEIKNAEQKSEFPYKNMSDSFLDSSLERIKNIFDDNNKLHTLTNETYEDIGNKYQLLLDEKGLRQKIIERKARNAQWFRDQDKIENSNFEEQPDRKISTIVYLTRIRYLFSNRGLSDEILELVGQNAFEAAEKKFIAEKNVSFESYAEFAIRGAMGNLLLFNDTKKTDYKKRPLLPHASPDLIEAFKRDLTYAIVDLSNRRKYPNRFLSSSESRALDIILGITGENSGTNEDVAYELDTTVQWAERLGKTAIEKLKNSPHALTLAKYFSS